ncbi:copper chaperone CopZ [Mechercharimyces sp. CAU 1602]|uniref:copper chaperone CopZ n=1 Tax=Mechercharimyces sp. CAU 1602 TaxID=2973933 RepID=UPI0021629BD7|nr:copper chaperone CopZ [Mechercharimyces sp. CAU 1602]MCS1351493.1 copper chaperone CopZ [Mechercharimyces sp. CAU 1602]
MEKATLNVVGMSCNHCVKAIEESVGKLEGVDQVKVHLSEKKVDVEFDSNKVTLKQIKETIDEQGYEAV